MAIDAAKLLNWPFEEVEQTYTTRDSILYALGLGLGADPMDERQLDFVFEENDFKALPTGEFWLDTTDFQIFHANLTWTKNVPIPILLRGIDFFSIEKKRVDGHWVYDRIAGRVQLRKIPFAPVPRTVEIQVTFDDYALNQGIPDDVFTN